MPETTALGAAMAAGAAEGVSVWSLNPEDLSEVTSEKFDPQINPEGTVSCHRRPLCMFSVSAGAAAAVTIKVVCLCLLALQRVSFGTLVGRRRCRNP